MFFAILMFGAPGKEIMYPDPGFPIYRSMIQYTGATAVPIALREENEFAFSADEVLAQITPRTSLIIINTPGNPTGGAVPESEIRKLVKGLEKHPNVCLMSDEIYSQMLYDGREHVSLLRYPEIRDRLIILDGWSKTYAMTGWRLGFSVWPRALAEHATRLCVNSHSCVNAPTQFAGIAALTGPQDAVHAMVKAFDERRRVIVAKLIQVRQPRRRVLCLPKHLRDGNERPRAAEQDAREGRRRDGGRNLVRYPRRGLRAFLLRQLGRKHFPRDRAHRQAFGRRLSLGRAWRGRDNRAPPQPEMQ
jgi:aspartate/methionine/tyrosine aminotransferase